MFEIGNSLREARLRKGLEFAEAEQATKIRSKYLRALEEERFELLPAQTYVKGFLRSYAEYLGLDGQLYVDEYNSRYVVGVDDEYAIKPRRTRPSRAQRRVESRALFVALAGIAAAAALVVIAWRWGSPDEQPIRPAGPAPSVTISVSTGSPTTASRNGWITLDLAAVAGDSGLFVKRGGAAGRAIYEGTLERGQERRFTGRVIWFQAAAPTNLVARVNGRRVALPNVGRRPLTALATRRGITAAPTG